VLVIHASSTKRAPVRTQRNDGKLGPSTNYHM
jgi:hypothetical protein